jgi:hypothetical protein
MTGAFDLIRLERPARVAVSNALRDGRLTKGPCCLESPDCRGPIQAHHDDYTKPLEVRWVCRGHHSDLNREFRAELRMF